MADSVWLAAYDELMNERELTRYFGGISHPSTKINLEGYDLIFPSWRGHALPMLQMSPGAHVFVRLYRMTKQDIVQLSNLRNLRLLKHLRTSVKVPQITSDMIQEQCTQLSDTLVLHPNYPYSQLITVGLFEGAPIYAMSAIEVHANPYMLKFDVAPKRQLLASIFRGLQETFPDFTQNFLFIYLNQKRGIMRNVESSILRDLA
jgi:hypothetical protein